MEKRSQNWGVLATRSTCTLGAAGGAESCRAGAGAGGRLMTREEASTREQYTAPRVAWAGVTQSAAGSVQPHQRRGHARAAGAHQVPALRQTGVGQLGEVGSASIHPLLQTQGHGAGVVSGQEVQHLQLAPHPGKLPPGLGDDVRTGGGAQQGGEAAVVAGEGGHGGGEDQRPGPEPRHHHAARQPAPVREPVQSCLKVQSSLSPAD